MDKTIEFTNEEIKMLKDACLVVISLMVGTKEEKDYRSLLTKVTKIHSILTKVTKMENCGKI
jgi:hypothetical protein